MATERLMGAAWCIRVGVRFSELGSCVDEWITFSQPSMFIIGLGIMTGWAVVFCVWRLMKKITLNILLTLAMAGSAPVEALGGSLVDLHRAASQGDLKSVRVLLENGDDPDLLNSDSYTPLHLAARNGHVDVARLLLDRGADPNGEHRNFGRVIRSPLHLAAEYNHVAVVELLASRGAKLNPKTSDWGQHTPLQLAYRHGNPDVAYVLLREGAKLSDWKGTGEGFKKKLLRLAIEKGHTDLETLLAVHLGHQTYDRVEASAARTPRERPPGEAVLEPRIGDKDWSEAARKRLKEIQDGGTEVSELASRIRDVREWVLDYIEDLPDFVCVQFNQDYAVDNLGHWRKIREVVAKVQMVDGKESYQTTSLDGRPSDEDWMRASGGVYGHFGTVLKAMFHRASTARFSYEGKGEVRDRPVDIFSVVHPKGYTFHKGVKRNGTLRDVISVGYEGKIYVDKDSPVVIRIVFERFFDIPRNYPIQGGTMQLDYDLVPIDGRRYWLPVTKRSVLEGNPETGFSRQSQTHTIWTGYQKFSAETKLTFSP